MLTPLDGQSEAAGRTPRTGGTGPFFGTSDGVSHGAGLLSRWLLGTLVLAGLLALVDRLLARRRF